MISAFEKSGGKRLRHAAAVLLLGVVEVACNENYRPIVQPVLPPPPNPAAIHFVVSLSSNGPSDPGSASHIDVSGDTYSGVFNTGVAPAHAALNPSGTKFYIANSGEDTVSVNSSGAAGTISLPGGSEPVFVHSRETGNMYVANYGNNTVSQINTTSDVVIATAAVGTHPVAMTEMPNGQKLYVVNQGSGTVSSVNVLGFAVGKTIFLPPGSIPVWAVARSDNARIYVLDIGGTVYDISTLSDSILGTSSSVGAGANFMNLDPVAQRLYVTNPTNGKVGVFDVSGTLNLLAVISLSQGASAPCPSGCSPVSVTGIGDGSRAYVASYQLTSCTDPLGNAYACVNTQVEVLNTGNNTISKVIPINTVPVDMTNPTGCGPATGPPAAIPWTPGTARFRAFAASSGGGSTTNFKVYVSQCDAGSIAVIDTTAVSTGSNPHAADVYTVSLPAPLSSFPPLQASISGANFSSGTTTYTYTPSNLGLQVGMKIFVTGMADSGNNGNFAITELATGTSCSPTAAGSTTCFVVTNSGGVTATTQNGSGTVLPPQNPVLVVAGP